MTRGQLSPPPVPAARRTPGRGRTLELAGDAARVFCHRHVGEIAAGRARPMPAAIDEHPAALLELERRHDAIAGLAHRRRHAVEQDLVGAVVVAARA